jgi:hypothetical protein
MLYIDCGRMYWNTVERLPFKNYSFIVLYKIQSCPFYWFFFFLTALGIAALRIAAKRDGVKLAYVHCLATLHLHDVCKAIWRQLDIRTLLSNAIRTPLATPLLIGWAADLIYIKSALSWPGRKGRLYYRRPEHAPFGKLSNLPSATFSDPPIHAHACTHIHCTVHTHQNCWSISPFQSED